MKDSVTFSMSNVVFEEIRRIERLILILAEVRDGRGPEKPEELADLLIQSMPVLERATHAQVASFRAPGTIAADLAQLRLGPLPAALPERLQAIWTRYAEEWLSEENESVIVHELTEVLRPYEEEELSLEERSQSIDVRTHRLKTLELLLALLDGLAGLDHRERVDEGEPGRDG